MMDDRTGIKAAKVCGAMFFTLMLALLLSVPFDFYYDLNDDTMIKDIVSGAYTGTPSGYCIQMLYPLAWCIASFYRAIPAVPWYGLFLCLCQFGVLFLVAVRLLFTMKSAGTRLMALAAEAAFAAGLFLREFVIIQYSVTSGICMAGAVFLFLTTPKTDKPPVFFRKNILSLFLVVLSFMLRTEICIMLMPFLLLAGLSGWCGEDRFFTAVNFRKYLMLIGTALLCMAAVYSLDLVAYRGSEWASFRSFFDARTKLYDFYGLPDYEAHRDFYDSIGLSRESYTLLENYNFALDESIDTWRLEAIVAYQEELARTSGQGSGLTNTFGFISRNSVGEALWCYKKQLLEDFGMVRSLILRRAADGDGGVMEGSVVRLVVLFSYLVYFMVCVVPARGRQRILAVIQMVCLLVVRGILWLYLYMVDRPLGRVTVPLLMMEFVMLAGFGICGSPVRRSLGCARYVLYALCAAGILVAAMGNLQAVRAEYDSRAAADERWDALMDYCRKNGNNYYIIDVYSSTSYRGAPYSEKLFTGVDNTYKNFDICGGWAAKSPLARQKLERYHFKDVQSALRGGSTARAYFVVAADKGLDWLAEYYEKRGMAVGLERVGQVRTPSGERVFDVYGLL